MYAIKFAQTAVPDQDRLNEEEVQALIGLWVERQSGAPAASVADVAEGLDITVEETRALLAEVRAARVDRQYEITQEQKRLAQEVKALATERTALSGADHILAQLRRQRSQVYHIRLDHQRMHARRRVKPTVPSSDSVSLAIVMLLSVLSAAGLAGMAHGLHFH